ncbi:hypothetical protein AGLY_011861 [Aphis glycines]|uniref:Uncharacterized protein n=1 Tax=Aphis glycines TaxID=307491 RepID=A0A6G0TBT6_APHGL|nr:hypothetical protein AGLY_011861 [Aphis glycines]
MYFIYKKNQNFYYSEQQHCSLDVLKLGTDHENRSTNIVITTGASSLRRDYLRELTIANIFSIQIQLKKLFLFSKLKQEKWKIIFYILNIYLDMVYIHRIKINGLIEEITAINIKNNIINSIIFSSAELKSRKLAMEILINFNFLIKTDKVHIKRSNVVYANDDDYYYTWVSYILRHHFRYCYCNDIHCYIAGNFWFDSSNLYLFKNTSNILTTPLSKSSLYSSSNERLIPLILSCSASRRSTSFHLWSRISPQSRDHALKTTSALGMFQFTSVLVVSRDARKGIDNSEVGGDNMITIRYTSKL